MKTPQTQSVIIEANATDRLCEYVAKRFNDAKGLVICDENTERFTAKLPTEYKIVLPHGVIADTEISDSIAPSPDVAYLIACGSGTVTDITRAASHRLGLPFISYPTAPSMDGYVSGIAAMTIKGQKLSLPSTPPTALFGDPEVYTTAPRRLTLAGVGDIIGKYISLCDWRVYSLFSGEEIDRDIEALVETSIEDMLKLDDKTPEFATAVLKGLINTGMAIQLYGSSRPSSGAEHHFSHLWEMHVINDETEALHGEKVGVSTLMLLEKYKSLDTIDFKHKPLDEYYLRPIFGKLTEGIIKENIPAESDILTPEIVKSKLPEIKQIIARLPEVDEIKAYYKRLGMKMTLAELDLPQDDDFIRKTFEFAPYVRKRMSLLRIM